MNDNERFISEDKNFNITLNTIRDHYYPKKYTED